MIPLQTVLKWQERFPDIPDLEAQMSKLGATILRKGPMHPGWECPEGWMMGVLSHMNQDAINKKRVTEAKIAAVQKTGRHSGGTRSKIDEI
jgi:hypothetical protein